MGDAPPYSSNSSSSSSSSSISITSLTSLTPAAPHTSGVGGVGGGGGGDSVKKKGKTSFLENLHDILENVDWQRYICWSEGGDSILIMDQQGFCSECLLQTYNHQNYSSFTRTLNVYGFSKVKHDPKHLEYRNVNFRRGERDLVTTIQRRANEKKKLNEAGTKRKLEEMAEAVDKLQTDVEAAGKRLSAIEDVLHLTAWRCGNVQTENKKLWDILDQAAPEVAAAHLQNQVASHDSHLQTPAVPLPMGGNEQAHYLLNPQQFHQQQQQQQQGLLNQQGSSSSSSLSSSSSQALAPLQSGYPHFAATRP